MELGPNPGETAELGPELRLCVASDSAPTDGAWDTLTNPPVDDWWEPLPYWGGGAGEPGELPFGRAHRTS